jgi:hypothetical protein
VWPEAVHGFVSFDLHVARAAHAAAHDFLNRAMAG